MDDFEKEYPGFDWRNIPAYKHPGGKNCPCPKHEHVKEQVKYAKQANKTSKEYIPPNILNFCPDHYKVYFNEALPAMPFKYKMIAKFAIKIGLIKIKQLKYMETDLCYYCRFGSGGFGKKNELPPM